MQTCRWGCSVGTTGPNRGRIGPCEAREATQGFGSEAECLSANMCNTDAFVDVYSPDGDGNANPADPPPNAFGVAAFVLAIALIVAALCLIFMPPASRWFARRMALRAPPP